MAVHKPVSQNPDDFVQGGLISDVDVEFKSFRFCLWDYNGTIPEPQLAVRGEITPLDAPDEEVEQYWSAGSTGDFVPSEDGKTINPSHDGAQMKRNSNWHMLLTSLKNCGVDTKILSAGDISVLDGLQAHIVRAPAPKREGLKSTAKEGREQTVLIINKVLKLPWEKKGRTGRVTVTVKPGDVATLAVAVGNGDDVLKSTLQGLVNVGDSIALKDLRMGLYKALAKEKDRNALVTQATAPAYLGDNGFLLEGDSVTRME